VRKKLRIAALIGCGLLLVIAAGLCGLYWAFKQQPDFYRQAIQVDPALQKKASDQMLQRAAALRSDLEKEGRWQALFTAEQINGWLAVDLVENYPDLLPESFRDPRVEIRPDRLTLACRLKRGTLDGVVTLTVEPYLAEPNVLALRVRSARAGLVPMPLSEILDAISAAAGQMNLHRRWGRAGGDPVALISISPPTTQDGRSVQIETLQLSEGEIYLAGTTRPWQAGGDKAERR
jgi:hypothetical protein